jgi:mannose-6-phosphate isomerase-like protein (cupin superfamily)
MRTFLFLLPCLAVTPLLRAQATPPSPFTAHTAAQLNQIEARLKLQAAASPTGDATQTLEDQGSNWIVLVVRAHTGEAEFHRDWSDEILVRSGTMTVFYGGTMSVQHAFGPRVGEFHSATMEGGTAQVLHAGDLMHIPASVPHWVKIAPGESASYLVFKEQ